jgi:hypothetical protein
MLLARSCSVHSIIDTSLTFLIWPGHADCNNVQQQYRAPPSTPTPRAFVPLVVAVISIYVHSGWELYDVDMLLSTRHAYADPASNSLKVVAAALQANVTLYSLKTKSGLNSVIPSRSSALKAKSTGV